MADLPLLEFDPERESALEPSASPREVPPGCLLCFFPEVVEKLARDAGPPLTTLRGMHPLYLLEGRFGLLYPGTGGPMAACLLEEAIAVGFRAFVGCGSAWALSEGAEVVVPFAAVRDEGTSHHYLAPGREVRADPQAVRVLEEELRASRRSYVLGRTWSTDAPYRQTEARRARRRQEGCLVADMETAALFAVARFRGVPLGQVLLAAEEGRDERHRRALREGLFWLAAEACLKLSELSTPSCLPDGR